MRYPSMARVGAGFAILVTALAATFSTALVLLSVTQPAFVARAMGDGAVGGLLRVVAAFVVSGVARVLQYL